MIYEMNYTRNILRLLTVILIISWSSPSLSSRRVIVNKQIRLALPHNIELAEVDRAVDGALAEMDWVKETDNKSVPRIVGAAYYLRTHKVWIEIHYDTEKITLTYIDSDAMKYKEKSGKQYIHANYNRWTRQLLDKVASIVAEGNSFSTNKKLKRAADSSNPRPLAAFSMFNNFKLEEVTIANKFSNNKGNIGSQKNLTHNLNLRLSSILETWSKPSLEDRTLLIKPHINAIRFVGSGARFWGGRWAGKSWVYVTVDYVDESSGNVIAAPRLYRAAVQAKTSLVAAKYDYIMIEKMAEDIARYTKNNFNYPVGGGVLPPQEMIDEFN